VVSTVAIVILALVAVLILMFIGGLAAARRHARETEGALFVKIAAADQALEAARAADRGWDRVLLDEAARRAIAVERPGFRYDSLHLVLVHDRPGIGEDRAEMRASGPDGDLQLVLVRHGTDAWAAESLA
jgi:hypothetical protein